MDGDFYSLSMARYQYWLACADEARSDAQFNESDHPRDNEGKFSTSGSGSSGKSSGAPKLSATEKTYISSYTGDDFLETNRQLRAGKSGGENVKALDKAIAKSKLPKGTKLYRGMSRAAAKALFPGGEINKGQVVSDKAFLSTSSNNDIASFGYGFGGVVLEIETKEDQEGLDVSKLTRNPAEREVLLPRNTKLRVTGIVDAKKPGQPVVVRVTTE